MLASALDAVASTDRRLADLAAALAAPRGRIEAAFLRVGSGLGDAAALLTGIVAAFEALPRELDGKQMQEATGRLETFSARACEIAAAFARERGEVHKLVAAVDSATGPVLDLRRAVRTMGILAVNARILAAGLADAADQFDVFTTDIAELSDGAARAVDDFVDGHGRLAAAVHAAAAQFEDFEATHRAALGALAGDLDRLLAEVTAQRRQSADRSIETARISHEMATRVGSAVMSLQVGDSTRQRVQHCEESLASLAAWLRGESEQGIEVHSSARDALLATVLDLQGAQLDGAIAAFKHETTEVEGALVDLAADAGAAIADCRGLYGGGRAGDSPVTALGGALQQAAALLRHCVAERARLDALAATVLETVDLLLGRVARVQEIEANMRLVGLNAAVKCAQLGPRGASLSVIAAQLRELTSELVPAAHLAVARLEDATRATQAFSAGATRHLADEVAGLEGEATAALDLLGTIDQRLSAALATLGRDGATALARLAEASHGLAGHAGIAEALSDVTFDIAAIVADAPPTVELHSSCGDALQRLRKRYSTEAERRIHDARLAEYGIGHELQPPVTRPASTVGEDADLADMLL